MIFGSVNKKMYQLLHFFLYLVPCLSATDVSCRRILPRDRFRFRLTGRSSERLPGAPGSPPPGMECPLGSVSARWLSIERRGAQDANFPKKMTSPQQQRWSRSHQLSPSSEKAVEVNFITCDTPVHSNTRPIRCQRFWGPYGDPPRPAQKATRSWARWDVKTPWAQRDLERANRDLEAGEPETQESWEIPVDPVCSLC